VTARVILAALVAIAGAFLGGAASKALRLHSFWPGVIAGFVVGFPLFIFLSGRLP
jgi:hypothetical protein